MADKELQRLIRDVEKQVRQIDRVIGRSNKRKPKPKPKPA